MDQDASRGQKRIAVRGAPGGPGAGRGVVPRHPGQPRAPGAGQSKQVRVEGRLLLLRGGQMGACRRSAGETLRGLSRRRARSEEHTSELQSRENLVCRLLLEKKKEVTTTVK